MGFMKRKYLISLMLLAAVSMTACGKAEKETDTGAESSDGEVKEFTAFFAVPGSEINDDNEIQQKIAEITGAKCKETWLTGQTAEEAVGTLIAGGEYPDLIDGGDGMAQLYDAGAWLLWMTILISIRTLKSSLQRKNGINFARRMDIFTGFHSSVIFTVRKKQQHTMMKHSGFRLEFLNGQIIRIFRPWMSILI